MTPTKVTNNPDRGTGNSCLIQINISFIITHSDVYQRFTHNSNVGARLKSPIENTHVEF